MEVDCGKIHTRCLVSPKAHCKPKMNVNCTSDGYYGRRAERGRPPGDHTSFHLADIVPGLGCRLLGLGLLSHKGMTLNDKILLFLEE